MKAIVNKQKNKKNLRLVIFYRKVKKIIIMKLYNNLEATRDNHWRVSRVFDGTSFLYVLSNEKKRVTHPDTLDAIDSLFYTRIYYIHTKRASSGQHKVPKREKESNLNVRLQKFKNEVLFLTKGVNIYVLCDATLSI